MIIDLETKIFYRLIKILHILFIGILSSTSVIFSAGPLIDHSWITATVILVIGFSLSYFIPTLIKQSLLYIAYGKKMVLFGDRFITATNLVSEHVCEAFNIYPKISYFSGICIFYAFAYVFNADFLFLLADVMIS